MKNETRERRLTNPELAYMNDCDFKASVDCLRHHLHVADFTPSELRKASVLAAIMYEREKPPPVFIGRRSKPSPRELAGEIRVPDEDSFLECFKRRQ